MYVVNVLLMRHRPVPTPQPSPEAEIDTPEMIEAALAAERDAYDVRVLTEVIESGLRLLQAQETYAAARLAAVTAQGAALNPGEDPTAACGKIAQTIRRTVALKKQLGEEIRTRRSGLLGERAARRAKRDEDHAEAVKEAIQMAMSEAHHADLIPLDYDPATEPEGDPPREIERREMLEDVEILLEDLEDYGDWRTRPVGETVAKLCEALDLAPDSCVRRGQTWWVRRCPTTFELLREKARVSRHPSPSGEGPTAKPSGWGCVGSSPAFADAESSPPWMLRILSCVRQVLQNGLGELLMPARPARSPP